MASYTDTNGFPEAGFPVLSDTSDRLVLNTLYAYPIKELGFIMDVFGPNRLLGALTIGGALTGVADLTMNGALSGATTIGASGTVTLSSATVPLVLSGIDAVLSMTGINASIGSQFVPIPKGYFNNLILKNRPTIDNDPLILLQDLQAYAVPYYNALKDLNLGAKKIISAELDFEIGATTKITKDGSNNLSFTDVVTGTKTLAELIANPMVYPGSGIAISTGSAWGTSITNNSANWNTAYGWGNHAGLYLPLAGGTMANTTVVTNLNADLLDGQQGSYYQPASTAITTSNIASQNVAYADNAGYAVLAGSAPANGGTALNIADETGSLRIANPNGASYSSDTSSLTGAIRILLPATAFRCRTMMKFKVNIYEYSTGRMRTIYVGGYNYQDGWYSISATQETQTGDNITVRFGEEGLRNVIYIGEVGTVWTFPQVTVTEFQGGYDNRDKSIWLNGWNIDFTTSFGTVTASTVAYRNWHSGNSNLSTVDWSAKDIYVNGKVQIAGSTSGNVSLQPNAIAGTNIVLTLPATTGTVALTSHVHGNILSTGYLGTTANIPLITGTAGIIQAGSFGTGANTFCQGNDSRLSDARTPVSHTHGNITNAGAIGSTAGLPVVTTTSGALTVGVTQTPQELTQSGPTLIWNIANGYNARVTLTASITTFTWSTAAVAGDSGILTVIQGGTGSYTIVVPSGHLKTNAFTLRTLVGSKDIIAWYYDGFNYFWNMDNSFA